MNDFNAALNKALRYSMDSVENMLTQLKSPDHNHTRWADGHPTADHTFRGVLADAIEESDRPHRHKEAALLRKAGQHIMVDGEGRVRPAKFTESPLFNAVGILADHTYTHNSDGFDGWGSTFHGDPDPVNPTDHDDYEPLGPNEHRFWDGEYDNFHHWKSHLSEVGPEIADIVDRRVEDSGDWENQEEEPERWAEYDRLIHNVRTAPYEEVDLGHTSERDNGFGFAMHHNEL